MRWNPVAPVLALARESAAAWMRRRQGVDLLPVALERRRLYILPTGTGVAFAALLFLMLIAGLNYGNSLALFLTFLLGAFARSEEHTSELQSRLHLVCRLLLEKKKKKSHSLLSLDHKSRQEYRTCSCWII